MRTRRAALILFGLLAATVVSADDCRQRFDEILKAPSKKVSAKRGNAERTYLSALSQGSNAVHAKLKSTQSYLRVPSLRRNILEASGEEKNAILIFTDHGKVEAIKTVEGKNETYQCY